MAFRLCDYKTNDYVTISEGVRDAFYFYPINNS